MKKIILTYGSIAGGVIVTSMILSLTLARGEELPQAAEWTGYLVMLVALSLIFVGIKRYRDRELGGVIRFGTGALLGLGITLVASVLYVVAWETYLGVSGYDFIGHYTRSVIEAKEAAGAAGEELAAVVASMETMKERYANPLFRVPMTFLEIFPVGLLVTLVSAGILRKSSVLPASR